MPGAGDDLAGGLGLRFVASVAAPARPAPLRALFGAPKRLALILTWIAAALLVSFATAGVTVAATPNGVVPVITGISPTSGPATGGTTVIITGAGFTSGSTVLFGTTPAASFTITSGTSISAVSPAGGGTVDIRVQKLNSESAPSSADQFTYTSSTPAPTVTGVNPSSGPPTGGTSVTLTGTNFVGVVGISFGGVAATSFTTNSSTQITVVAPPFSTSGSVNVIVTAQGGVSAANGNAVYTYMNTGAPTVTGLSPSGGPTSGGTGVLITGTNFTGATATLTFGEYASALVHCQQRDIDHRDVTGGIGRGGRRHGHDLRPLQPSGVGMTSLPIQRGRRRRS